MGAQSGKSERKLTSDNRVSLLYFWRVTFQNIAYLDGRSCPYAKNALFICFLRT